MIASGHDFYAPPRVSPDGTRIAWLAWDHPRMPWEGCELYVDGRLVAGGPAEAIVQPEWSPDGVLHYSSDRTGWWNLYREDGEPVTALEAEIGGPLWVFGAVLVRVPAPTAGSSARTSATAATTSRWSTTTALRDVPIELHADRRPHHRRRARAVRRRLPHALAAGRRRRPRHRRDRAAERGRRRGRRRRLRVRPAAARRHPHALFYPPHNPDFTAPPGERPPLVVRIHGGPTAHVSAIAVARRSSSSPAAASRSSTSTTAAAPATAASTATGCAASGASSTPTTPSTPRSRSPRRARPTATGWRSPAAAPAAGPCCARSRSARTCSRPAPTTSASPISSGFVDDTHKFESRYNDWLVGPWPETADLWRERSPINHADKIRAPVIVLQGLEDKVVPPSQSEKIVEALARNGIRHEYIAFEGEQHGFRKAENLRRAAEAELAFYLEVFEPMSSRPTRRHTAHDQDLHRRKRLPRRLHLGPERDAASSTSSSGTATATSRSRRPSPSMTHRHDRGQRAPRSPSHRARPAR